jgi:ectoine hydroxylase-related dioxygenase (phytanoyl-CoA dioxygenase family)
MNLDAKKRQLAEEGCCTIPGVFDAEKVADVRERLWKAADESERRGMPTRNIGIDPNRHNVRVFNLIDIARHPLALELATHLLGPDFLLSNLTANIALPGSKSMKIHSDQGIVIPEPWFYPWAINIIWCLNDVHERNGATRYIPGSHRIKWTNELPPDAAEKTVPFEAKAGSIVVMDGRVWHTSGANVTDNEERAMLFGYYSRSFIRPQQNWNAGLSQATIDGLDLQMRALLGLDANANTGLATPLKIEVEA